MHRTHTVGVVDAYCVLRDADVQWMYPDAIPQIHDLWMTIQDVSLSRDMTCHDSVDDYTLLHCCVLRTAGMHGYSHYSHCVYTQQEDNNIKVIVCRDTTDHGSEVPRHDVLDHA